MIDSGDPCLWSEEVSIINDWLVHVTPALWSEEVSIFNDLLIQVTPALWSEEVSIINGADKSDNLTLKVWEMHILIYFWAVGGGHSASAKTSLSPKNQNLIKCNIDQ